METFAHNLFRFSTEYPQSGSRVQLGQSYQYDLPPSSPDQRLFILKFAGMRYGSAHPNLNMTTLESFYNRHKLYKEFTLTHPLYGPVVCKFMEPLRIPEIGQGGILAEFEVRLIEIP